MMRAVGLFAAYHDDDALKALIRASKKKRWDDYVFEEKEGVVQLWESAFGKPNGLTKIYIAEMELSLYLALIRAIVRVAVCKAVELERKGELAEGLEIRPALIRCARLMKEQQKSRLPRLLAFPIAHTAMVHPKGEPLPKPKEGQEQGRLIQIRFIFVWLMGLTFLGRDGNFVGSLVWADDCASLGSTHQADQCFRTETDEVRFSFALCNLADDGSLALESLRNQVCLERLRSYRDAFGRRRTLYPATNLAGIFAHFGYGRDIDTYVDCGFVRKVERFANILCSGARSSSLDATSGCNGFPSLCCHLDCHWSLGGSAFHFL